MLVTSPGDSPERFEKRVCFAEADWDSSGPVVDGGGIGGQFIKGKKCMYVVCLYVCMYLCMYV